MNRPGDGNLLEIIDLAHSLRQEHLYVANEQKLFRTLNATLHTNASNVAQLAWICAQQRHNLNSLIVSRADAGPTLCCVRANQLANTRFVDAHKAPGLKYQHVLSYIELFNFLHRSPYLLAQALAVGDRDARLSGEHMRSVVHTIVSGLYGNAILSKDVDMLLRLARELIEIQIVCSDNPRRLLRSSASSAFARIYHRLHESLFSAKLFLTSALHESVMRVLIEDEQALDVDLQRTIDQLPADERLRRFGVDGTGEYEAKCTQFRAATLRKLHRLSSGCVQSLLDNWTLFPSTLRWVVQTMCHLLKTAHVPAAEINHILTDMVFTHFICPAIVSPDLFGITDAPVSENARHNLIQIGQVLQMLALTRHEPVDVRFDGFLVMFPHNIVADLMEQLQVTEYDVSVSMMAIPHQNDFGREHVLVTQTELNVFVAFLRGVLDFDGLSVSGEDRQKLGHILDQLPDRWETVLNGGTAANGALLVDASASSASPPGSASRTKQSLINLGKTTKTRLAKTMSMVEGGLLTGGEAPDDADTETAAHNNNSLGSDEFDHVLIIPIAISDESKFQLLTEHEVLKMNNISGTGDAVDGPKAKKGKPKTKCPDDDDVDGVNADDDDDDDDDDDLGNVNSSPSVSGLLMRGSRARRFDDRSLGNGSDNLEVVSEVPSNHSVSSSVEMEEHYQNMNDNLSDMVSANVSGRGSPNISGRDTPSSQVTDGIGGSVLSGGAVGDLLVDVGAGDAAALLADGRAGDGRPGDGRRPPGGGAAHMAKMMSKTRSDIDDKFGKFVISKRVLGEGVDETISIISDTWSTDVLASDSETLEPSDAERDRNFATPLIPASVVLPGDQDFDALGGGLPTHASLIGSVGGGAGGGSSLLDVSETRSESAWSTDVLASDSEKLIEIDTDDNNSVTASLDTMDGVRPLPASMRAPLVALPAPIASPASAGRSPMNGSPATVGCDASAGRVRISSDDFARFLGPIVGQDTTTPVAGGSSPAAVLPSIGAYSGSKSMSSSSTSSMRRQNSAESSISTHSSTNEHDAVFGAVGGGPSSLMRRSFAGVRILKTSTKLVNPFANAPADDDDSPVGRRSDDAEYAEGNLLDLAGDPVQQRVVSAAQRSTSYDGRRNGIMSTKALSMGAAEHAVGADHGRSLNYENHDIIYKARATSLHAGTAAITDDDKSRRQQQLIDHTLALSIADEAGGVGGQTAAGEASVTVTGKTAVRYTGAIPKSISFDESANKRTSRHSAHRNGDDQHEHANGSGAGASIMRHTHGSSFFNKLKQGFRNRRSHHQSAAHQQHHGDLAPGGDLLLLIDTESPMGEGNATTTARSTLPGIDGCDDILAKYRRKISSSSEATNSDSLSGGGGHRAHGDRDVGADAVTVESLLDELPMLLTNAKRKLRLVLSTTDLHTADFRHTSCRKIPPLMTYLQIQLAQALNLQNLQQIAFISETIRCLRQLDDSQQRQLIADLQQDLISRQSYLQYLMRYRQHLLSALENIDRFEDRLRNDRDMCNRHLIMVCVRLFLEKRQPALFDFQREFNAQTVVDEKIDCMNEFMDRLMVDLLEHGVMQSMSAWQRREARAWIERALVQKLYRQVMFPNDDADISRDEVLRIHIDKLSRLITPAHPLLRIPHEYRVEAPWPFAQQQIAYISAYKTPREKVQCVVRCITSIMNLLQMASNRAPAADDLVPVLIFVVIKANPPYLMSTIQYVNAFIGHELEGEDQYWWTQFSAAVTFIKTMDYNH